MNTTVNGLDQYHQVTEAELTFRGGSPLLTADSKTKLDELAASLTGREGYIIEMEAHSPMAGSAGIQSSERLDEAVKRYLVTEHQIPVYRMHSVALGNETMAMNSCRSDQKPERVRNEQCASGIDGKQFGGPGRSVTPKRSRRSWHGAAVRSRPSSPEALL